MRDYYRLLCIDFGFVTCAFFLALSFFNLVPDDYAFFMGALASKQFSDFAYFDVHFQGFIGIREIYKFLYSCWPDYNWHFIFAMLFEWLSLFVIVRSLRKTVFVYSSRKILYAGIVVVSLIYIENIITVSHTRFSIIFCGIALINLVFSEKLEWSRFFSNSALFVLGMLLRPESGLGSIMLVGAGFFIFNPSILFILKRLFIPLLGMSLFFVAFFYDLAHTNVYVRKVEPEIEYKMMARSVKPLSDMKTAKDSIKLKAAVIGMWFDTKEMSPEFLRTLIMEHSDYSFKYSQEVISHVLEFYKYYLIVPVLYLVFIGFSLLGFINKWQILKLVVFMISAFILMVTIDYNGILLSNRHFISMHILVLLICCTYLFRWTDTQLTDLKMWVKFLALMVVLFSLTFLVIQYKNENRALFAKLKRMEKIMQAFENKYNNRIVAVTIDCRFLFDQHFTIRNHNYKNNTYIMFDWFTFGLTPRYIDYMSRICQCDASDPSNFFKWLAQNNALYLSEINRFNLTEQYMKQVHGINLRFINPEKVNKLGKMDEIDTRNCEVRLVNIGNSIENLNGFNQN